MKSLRCLWLCLLSLCLPLLFWFGHVIMRDSRTPPGESSKLRGYKRISLGMVDQFLNMHCSSCAVVSSSGHMLGADAGAEINEAKCVVRMNNAPTQGYEKDVGKYTNIRVVSHTSVPGLIKKERYFFQQQANTTYVFWGPEKHMRQDGSGRIYNVLLNMAVKYPNVSMYALTQKMVQHCDDVFQHETGKNRMKSGAFLSTGFFTMILALDLCDSIYVYGMVNENYCSQTNRSFVPYHYYQKGPVNECNMYQAHESSRRGGHRFITEKAIYARWAGLHKIEFRYPSWSP